MLREIIFLNGIYDLLCAASHLLNQNNALTKLHGDLLLLSREDPAEKELQQRMLAYWILTYGLVRLAAAAPLLDTWECVVASNYFVEAFAYAMEGFVHGTVDGKKAAFVCVTSAGLGAAVLFLIWE